jgi:hypothetical protein
MFGIKWTTEEYSQSWWMMQEQTASGLSGIHIAHMTANAIGSGIGEMDSVMMMIALKHSITPYQWAKGVAVLLENQPGYPLLSKYQTILLLKPDFYHANK